MNMANGILIMGSSGAGKTTLGELVAKELNYTFVDIDEYIWRKDTEIPFTAMYSRNEKIERLQAAISDCEHFVMAGSMDSFHEHFDPYFELVVHLHTDEKIRVKRVHERELEWFGERVLEGGRGRGTGDEVPDDAAARGGQECQDIDAEDVHLLADTCNCTRHCECHSADNVGDQDEEFGIHRRHYICFPA